MHARRIFAAAVFAHAVCAGTIASRNGSATVAPMPPRTVRREMCFFVMNMSDLLSSFAFRGRGRVRVGRRRARSTAHLKWRALHDAKNERRDAIVVRGRLTHDGSNNGHVVVLNRTSERI